MLELPKNGLFVAIEYLNDFRLYLKGPMPVQRKNINILYRNFQCSLQSPTTTIFLPLKSLICQLSEFKWGIFFRDRKPSLDI